MWNIEGTAPAVVTAETLTRMPDELRVPAVSSWSAANKPGETIDSFIEGPAFDRAGNLFVTDIPSGRVFRIDGAGHWSLAGETGGWPNGLAVHADGTVYVADYRRGILRLDPSSGEVGVHLGHRNSESFKGVNDLTFDASGNLYFTDQGQTGLHDPSGRVYRQDTSGRLDVLIGNGPSPNGLAVAPGGRILSVAMTRANAVWRGPIQSDGSASKVGAFRTFYGASGPDGLAYGAGGELVVAHASLGGAFVCNPRGDVTHFVKVPFGRTVTNVAFKPGTGRLVLTESETGTVFAADLPFEGAPLFSHSR